MTPVPSAALTPLDRATLAHALNRLTAADPDRTLPLRLRRAHQARQEGLGRKGTVA